MPAPSPEEEPAPRKGKLHPNIWVLTATSLLTDVSSEMVVNLIPLFLTNVLGVRTVVVGLIEGLAETAASLVKLLSGSLADRLDQRKILAVYGYGLSTLVKPLLYFASSWGWVLGIRFTDRIGKGIRTAPRDALLAGSVDIRSRGFAFGLHRAGDTAGAFLGLAIAGGIIWGTQAQQANLTRTTFQWVVLASILPSILAVLILALGASEVGRSTLGENPEGPGKGWYALNPRYRAFLVIVVVFTLGNSSDAFILLRAQERGLTVLQLIGMSLTFTAIYASLSGLMGSLSDRIGRARVILGGWLFYGLIYLGLALAQSGAEIWILYGLYGAYYAATEGTAKAQIADLVSPTQRGTAYGLYHAAVGLSTLPASMVAGTLWQGIGAWSGAGPAAPFYFGASLGLLAALLLVFWMRAAD